MKTAVLMIACVIAMNGCATMNQPRESTTATIPMKAPEKESMSAVMRALATNGFQIKSFDKESGILNTEPKQFAIPRGVFGIKAEGATRVQVVAYDKAVQVQVLEECRYDRANVAVGPRGGTTLISADGGYSVCVINDADANAILPEQDRRVLNIIRVALGQPEIAPPPPAPKPQPTAKQESNPFRTGGS